MTTYWAAVIRGLDYRYETKIHIVPVSADVADVHFQGSLDPFFQPRTAPIRHFSAQPPRGKKGANLSFDENFKYRDSTRDTRTAVGHYGREYPVSEVVQDNLQRYFSRVNGLYSGTRQRAKDLVGIDLPQVLSLAVSEVKIVAGTNLPKTRNFRAPKLDILSLGPFPWSICSKEMNRTSNNYVANLIFESLGGPDRFKKFIKNKVGLDESQILFVNGSGDRLDLDGEKAGYNEASCQAIVAVIGALKAETEHNIDVSLMWWRWRGAMRRVEDSTVQ